MGRPAGQEARVTADERRPLAPLQGVKPRAVAPPLPPLAHAPRNEVLNQAAQQALASQEAANALWAPPPPVSGSSRVIRAYEAYVEPPPSSGVRVSESRPAALEVGVPVDSRLSFKAYTVADLERQGDAPLSYRASRANFDRTSSRSSRPWQRAMLAVRAFATASLAWFRTKNELGLRDPIKVALRRPFDELGDELQVAVESIDWKKVGVTTGIIVGATLTLLFAVLTAAELTDDLRPAGSAAHLASTETSGVPARTALGSRSVAPATNMTAMGVQPVAVAPAPEAAAAPEETPEAAPPPKKAKKAGSAKAKPKLGARTAPF